MCFKKLLSSFFGEIPKRVTPLWPMVEGEIQEGEPVGRVPPLDESFPHFLLVKKMGRLFDGAARPVQGVQAQIAETKVSATLLPLIRFAKCSLWSLAKHLPPKGKAWTRPIVAWDCCFFALSFRFVKCGLRPLTKHLPRQREVFYTTTQALQLQKMVIKLYFLRSTA